MLAGTSSPVPRTGHSEWLTPLVACSNGSGTGGLISLASRSVFARWPDELVLTWPTSAGTSGDQGRSTWDAIGDRGPSIAEPITIVRGPSEPGGAFRDPRANDSPRLRCWFVGVGSEIHSSLRLFAQPAQGRSELGTHGGSAKPDLRVDEC